jgi:hypothetical protein
MATTSGTRHLQAKLRDPVAALIRRDRSIANMKGGSTQRFIPRRRSIPFGLPGCERHLCNSVHW